MNDFIKLFLPRDSVHQILDAFEYRMLIWKATQEYRESGYTDLSDAVEDCPDPQEALANADYYQYLIDTIKNQVKEQNINNENEKE
jgi:hypothetical protein